MKQISWLMLLAGLVVGLGLSVRDTEAAMLKRQITSCGNIAQPGLYTLTQNVAAAGDCIVIQVDFVTVDLSSYVITGNGTGSGITVNGPHQGIVIRDGTITNFLYGIYLPACTNTLIERMQVIQTNGFGALTGSEANVKDSFFAHSGPGYAGLTVGEDSVVTGNIATYNGDIGIALGGGRSTAIGNVARGNSGSGIKVFTGGATLVNNTSAQNGFYGLEVLCPSNLIGNTSVVNGAGAELLTGATCNDSNNVLQ